MVTPLTPKSVKSSDQDDNQKDAYLIAIRSLDEDDSIDEQEYNDLEAQVYKDKRIYSSVELGHLSHTWLIILKLLFLSIVVLGTTILMFNAL